MAAGPPLPGNVVFEKTSAYHHIRVMDYEGMRTLSFDSSAETRISLVNPLQGHFEYTEYFHLPWLWNTNLTHVLMVGLGGGSTPCAFAHYYPDLVIDTVEIDPVVYQVATQYFSFHESANQRVNLADGRVFLRRSQDSYGAILLDAYVESRYGAAVPYHLVTREFFGLAKNHLTTNGVVAMNCIGTLQGWRADLLGAIYRTMKSVFPRVYLFPARESRNVMLIATMDAETVSPSELRRRALQSVQAQRLRLPTLWQRLAVFRADPPPNLEACPVLTDEFAPVDGLLTERQ